MAVFKTLERYGHYLKHKHGDGLRRHIRFDDYDMTLVMDFCLPLEDTWHRTDYENAREELRANPNSSNYRPFSSSSASDVTEPSKPWGVPVGAQDGRQQQQQQQQQQQWDQEGANPHHQQWNTPAQHDEQMEREQSE